MKNEKSAQRGSFRAGHPADIRGGYPDPKLRSGPSKSLKNKHLGADIHDPKARTSTTPRDLAKLRPGKLWAELSFPKMMLPGKRYEGDIREGGVHEVVSVPLDICLDVSHL